MKIPNKSNRTLVLLAPTNKVPDRTDNDCSSKHDDGPVEGFGSRISGCWPWGPEKAEHAVDKTNCVDWRAPATKRPLSRRERLRSECSSPEYAADGQSIGGHEGHELE